MIQSSTLVTKGSHHQIALVPKPRSISNSVHWSLIRSSIITTQVFQRYYIGSLQLLYLNYS